MFTKALRLLLWMAVLAGCAAPTAITVATPRPTASLVPPTATAIAMATPPAATAVPAPIMSTTSTYEIVNAYPHDVRAFTEGLIFYRGEFYESTGLNGQSSLRRVKIETGVVLQKIELPPQYFGEGLTLFNDHLFQLTWQNQTGLVYDRATFKQVGLFAYPMQGWGITHDGRRLIISDGTPVLHFYDPAKLVETQRITVTLNGQPVAMLNELEYVRGEIYANVWQTNFIARIDPASGRVLGMIDLTGLLGPADRQQPVDVLNGIAYDSTTDRLFVTGKLWPKVFEIKIR